MRSVAVKVWEVVGWLGRLQGNGQPTRDSGGSRGTDAGREEGGRRERRWCLPCLRMEEAMARQAWEREMGLIGGRVAKGEKEGGGHGGGWLGERVRPRGGSRHGGTRRSGCGALRVNTGKKRRARTGQSRLARQDAAVSCAGHIAE